MPMSILYYPSINIEDSAWLRNAVLYWDSVSSIVPDEYNPSFPEEIEYLRQEGIYYPTFPSKLFSYDYKNVCQDFQVEVVNKLKSSKNWHPNLATSRLHRTKLYWPELSTMIHYRKISGELYSFLVEKNLVSDYGGDWIEMDAHAAEFYMSTLAKYLANIADTHTTIGTDKATSLNKAFSKSFPNRSNFNFAICFQHALPAPNPNVPLKKFVAFRRKRAEELLQLREKINKFENSISHCENLEEIRNTLSNFRDEWTLAQYTYEKILQDDRIAYTLSSMKSFCATSVPGVLTAIGSSLGAPIPKWLTVTSLAAGGAIGVGCNYIQHRRDVHNLRDRSGFAYLFDASKKNLISTNSSTLIL